MFFAIPVSAGPVDFDSRSWREDHRVIQGGSFQELRELIDTFETHFLEEVGACNICRVGERFAVVPHVLGPVNFLHRADRENPLVVWAETLSAARRAADEMAVAGATAMAGPARREKAPSSETFRATDPKSNLAPFGEAIQALQRSMSSSDANWGEIANIKNRVTELESALAGMYRLRSADVELVQEQIGSLQRQLTAVDSGLTAIYRSRTWQALTSIRRVFPGAPSPHREGKNGAE
jgi:hypothetical protein